MASSTVTVYRDGYICGECHGLLDRNGACESDESHKGLEWAEDVEEIEVDVSAHVTPYVPARTSGDPDDCYPAEGGDVEDLTATVDGKPFELTAEEYADACERVGEAAGEYEGLDYDPCDEDPCDDICDQYYDPY